MWYMSTFQNCSGEEIKTRLKNDNINDKFYFDDGNIYGIYHFDFMYWDKVLKKHIYLLKKKKSGNYLYDNLKIWNLDLPYSCLKLYIYIQI